MGRGWACCVGESFGQGQGLNEVGRRFSTPQDVRN